MSVYDSKNLKKIEQYVTKQLAVMRTHEKYKDLLYHGPFHTLEEVYPQAMRLAKHQELSKEETFILGSASLFHDMGFLKQYNHNEPLGAQAYFKYMSKQGYAPHICFKGMNAILNTAMKKDPENEVEKILRDADLAYLAYPRKEFLKRNEALRWESYVYSESPLNAFAQKNTTWLEDSIEFMERHKEHDWFSAAAKELYSKQRTRNLNYLKTLLKQKLQENYTFS